MNVEESRAWFIFGSLALILLVATPTLGLFVRLPDVSDKFSEFWLLGPGRKAGNYPFNIVVNEIYQVYACVENHLGYSAYYRVLVKFRNQSQPLPVGSNSTRSPLPAIYEFNIFVRDGGVAEKLLRFEIIDVICSDTIMTVNKMSINEATPTINGSATWNAEGNGFFYQFFFELWLYNATVQRHDYNNRFVGFWVNITA